jgi:hypothetical protein
MCGAVHTVLKTAAPRVGASFLATATLHIGVVRMHLLRMIVQVIKDIKHLLAVMAVKQVYALLVIFEIVLAREFAVACRTFVYLLTRMLLNVIDNLVLRHKRLVASPAHPRSLRDMFQT